MSATSTREGVPPSAPYPEADGALISDSPPQYDSVVHTAPPGEPGASSDPNSTLTRSFLFAGE